MRNTILTVLVLAIIACAPVTTNTTTNETNITTVISLPENIGETEVTDKSDKEVPKETTPTEPKELEGDFAAKLSFTEGELIKLKTYAVDPDNDKVTLTFSKPFDKNGVWQTTVGDAGDYPVTVVAEDSKGASTTQRILVSIKYANRAPVIEGLDNINVKEGESVDLSNYKATDADGDEVILSFSGWMKSATYQTTYDDAGEHTVTITAEDGKTKTKKTVVVKVEGTNRAPVISIGKTSLTTTELESVTIKATASDPDGDPVELTFGSPFNDKGEWTPALDQAGDYTVAVTATDGKDSASKDVNVHVKKANRAPVIVIPSQDGIITVKEGELIDLQKLIEISDSEGEEITVTYAGWMKSATYQTTYDDAGKYVVTVTAVDKSKHTVSKDITVLVEDVNRPPVFVKQA